MKGGKTSALAGEKIEITAKKGVFSGILVNNQDKGFLVKLSSGYNAWFSQSEVLSIKKLGEKKELSKPPAKEMQLKPGLPLISIIHLGGTIASRVDYKTGAVKVSFEPKDLLTMYPELEKIANFRSRLVGQMFSEDMRFAHYKKLALEIKKEIGQNHGLKGIIVTHGTDTMHYSTAAMSFVFENLPLPVIFVGAQRSADRGSSDAAINLAAASQFIANTDFKGVAICMHESCNDSACLILSPTQSRKLHTTRRDAFKPVNSKPIAKVDPETGKIEFFSTPQVSASQFSVKPAFEEKIGILKAHPNLSFLEIDFFRKNKYKGLVIEGTGLGHIGVGVPDELSKPNKKNMDSIKKLLKSGCVVAMTSQCIFGSVHSHVYEDAVALEQAGVIYCHDMSFETAFVKLSWLLGNFSSEEAKTFMPKNLRGEISEKIPMETFPPKEI